MKNHCQQEPYSQRFVRIIDGGSTGSRLHTFEYLPNNRIATVGTSSHVDTPLSDHVHSTSLQIKEHLLPLFLNDIDEDDDTIHRLTERRIPVYYGATAGMRLVEPHWQTALYDRVLSSLNDDSKFSQYHAMVDVFTLSGTDEAYYGALAANYLAGTQQQQTKPLNTRLLGALDIGGASTQLVSPLSDDNITKENFFAISLLGYGVDQFQKRLFSTTPALHDSINPCLNDGYLPMAQGNATACAEWMRPVLADVTDRITTDISTDRDYWAMSLFYFSFDALRHFTADVAVQTAWPTPTLSQLRKAGETLCNIPWQVLTQQQPSHKYTRNEKDLSKRCFEAVYLVELLTAMKFTDQHVIQYMLYTDRGDEVEWTLGMAMALRDVITQECLDDTDVESTATTVDLDKEEGVNRTENNNGPGNITWARLLSNVLSADDFFTR